MTEKMNEIFSMRFREAIDRMPLTRRDFANLIGVTESTVQNWLNGSSSPNLAKIDDISHALGVSPRWLFGANEEVPMRDSLIVRGQMALYQIEDMENLRLAVEAIENIREADQKAGKLKQMVKNRGPQ